MLVGWRGGAGRGGEEGGEEGEGEETRRDETKGGEEKPHTRRRRQSHETMPLVKRSNCQLSNTSRLSPVTPSHISLVTFAICVSFYIHLIKFYMD